MPGVRGLILCGRLGAGKTTAVAAIRDVLDARIPVTMTTRPVSERDIGLHHVEHDDFVEGVHRGRILMPIISGDHMYGWEESELNFLREHSPLVFSTRPYTALAVAALIPGLQPVWLELPERERLARIAHRMESRDRDEDGQARTRFDEDDSRYRKLFRIRFDSTSLDLVSTLGGLYDR